jgi:hypothetical protein
MLDNVRILCFFQYINTNLGEKKQQINVYIYKIYGQLSEDYGFISTATEQFIIPNKSYTRN